MKNYKTLLTVAMLFGFYELALGASPQMLFIGGTGGNGQVAVPIGADGLYLSASSSQPNGVVWIAVSGGGAGSTGVGGNAATSTAGLGKTIGGGDGGAGSTNNAAGLPGFQAGGGGAGGHTTVTANKAGGSGAQGQVKITYNLSDVVPQTRFIRGVGISR